MPQRHGSDNLIMGMAVIALVVCRDLRHICQIMGLHQHTHCQDDGQHKPDKVSKLLSHCATIAGLGPLALSPQGGYA